MLEEVLDGADPFACDFEEEPHEDKEDRDSQPGVEQDSVNLVRGREDGVAFGFSDYCGFNAINPGEEFICLGQSAASAGTASISRVDGKSLRTRVVLECVTDNSFEKIRVVVVARVYGENRNSQFIGKFIDRVFLAVLLRNINHGGDGDNGVTSLCDLSQKVQRTRHCASVQKDNSQINFSSGSRVGE